MNKIKDEKIETKTCQTCEYSKLVYKCHDVEKGGYCECYKPIKKQE